jgi:hypothetical protein
MHIRSMRLPRQQQTLLSNRGRQLLGGRTGAPLRVLCQACYDRFLRRGTLERAINKPLTSSARRCTYDQCDCPDNSRRFYQIEDGSTAGGQDWSSVAGNVLCQACYDRFLRRGTLEPSEANVRKKQKTAHHPKSSMPSSSTPPPSACTALHQEEEEVADPDTGECMICLGESRTMCIVPCGRHAQCASCRAGTLGCAPLAATRACLQERRGPTLSARSAGRKCASHT